MNRSEFAQAVWEQHGIRIDRPSDAVQINDVQRYKTVDSPNKVNTKRDELIQFIRENNNRLSLPCDGDCYNHHDGVVLFCHAQLLEDNNGRKNS